jgi:uncharacterized membrane protein
MTEQNDSPPPAPSTGGQGAGNLTTLTHIVYGLYVAGFFIGLTAIAGVIICYLKRGDAAGDIVESHMTWLIRTFWIGLVGGIVGGLLMFIFIGMFVLISLAIYLIYRIAKGWIKLLDNQPIADPQGWF